MAMSIESIEEGRDADPGGRPDRCGKLGSCLGEDRLAIIATAHEQVQRAI
jgi:hypothetical protein